MWFRTVTSCTSCSTCDITNLFNILTSYGYETIQCSRNRPLHSAECDLYRAGLYLQVSGSGHYRSYRTGRDGLHIGSYCLAGLDYGRGRRCGFGICADRIEPEEGVGLYCVEGDSGRQRGLHVRQCEQGYRTGLFERRKLYGAAFRGIRPASGVYGRVDRCRGRRGDFARNLVTDRPGGIDGVVGAGLLLHEARRR